MSRIVDDLRYAIRSLRKAPLFTAIAVISMSFGIAANTAVFTLVDQVILRQLPVEHPETLVQVAAPNTESYGGGMGDGTELSYAMYKDLRDGNQVFDGMFCRMFTSMRVGFAGSTEQVNGELVSGTFFPLLGVKPVLGRLFTSEDDRTLSGAPYVVLSYGYWKARFAGDPAVIGKTVQHQQLSIPDHRSGGCTVHRHGPRQPAAGLRADHDAAKAGTVMAADRRSALPVRAAVRAPEG